MLTRPWAGYRGRRKRSRPTSHIEAHALKLAHSGAQWLERFPPSPPGPFACPVPGPYDIDIASYESDHASYVFDHRTCIMRQASRRKRRRATSHIEAHALKLAYSGPPATPNIFRSCSTISHTPTPRIVGHVSYIIYHRS